MEVVPTAHPEVLLLKPKVFRDQRGFFLETWQEVVFRDAGVPHRFVQDNHSRSIRHTLRGLHYQVGAPQGKLVRAATGRIFDVAVDLRRSSPSYGSWVGAVLSDENHHMLWVPPGFAHGFLVLSEQADLVYKCTELYSAPDDRAIRWDDPTLGIEWPVPAGVEPLLSPRDRSAPLFTDAPVFP